MDFLRVRIYPTSWRNTVRLGNRRHAGIETLNFSTDSNTALSHKGKSKDLPTTLVVAVLGIIASILGPSMVLASEVSEFHLLTAEALEERAEADPSNISIKLALVRKYGQNNQLQAIELLDLIPTAELNPSQHLIVESMRCEINIRRGEMDTASQHCEGLETALQSSEVDGLSRALAFNALGYLQVRGGQAELALKQFESGLQVLGFDDEVIRTHLLHNRGVALNLSGLTELAIDAFESADNAKDVLASDESLPIILAYNLGYVQAQAGKHAEALKSFATTLPWLEETGQLTRAFISHTQVALSLSGLGQHQAALDELSPWLNRSDFSVSPDSAAQAQLALAQAYFGLGDSENGERSLLEGIEIASSSNNPSRLRELSLVYAEMLLERDQPQAAADYLNAMFEMLELNDLRAGLGPAHDLMAQAYAALGEYETALVHSQDAMESFQVTQNEDFARRLASLRVSNELDIKNQELATAIESERAAVASQQLERVVQIFIISSLIILLIFVFLNLSRSASRAEAKLQKESAKRLKAEVEERTREVEQALEEKYASEQRKAELEIRVAKDDKLRVIGQLTGGVAHDFNNIMTVVQLSSELLLMKLDSTQQKLAKDILTAVNSGKAITRGLLAYARQQVLQPTTIELSEFFASNKDIFMRSIDESFQFKVQLDEQGGPLVIKADAGQLTSSILNLILNAREAITDGGVISLSASRLADKVFIEISDNGRGMSENEIKASSEPFYTTKAMADGSGLGLSMVEGFMKQSGGELTIRSAVDEGTTIILQFQAASSAYEEQPQERVPQTAIGNYSILLVEDEDQIRRVATEVLEEAGYSVISASSADDALNKYSQASKINLVITDMVMPGGLSGEKLIEELHKTNPELPVLIMSGYAAQTSTGYPLLAKPFSTSTLLSKAKELIQA